MNPAEGMSLSRPTFCTRTHKFANGIHTRSTVQTWTTGALVNINVAIHSCITRLATTLERAEQVHTFSAKFTGI